MNMLWTLALKELRDGLRNRWIAAAIIVEIIWPMRNGLIVVTPYMINT